MLVLDQVTKNFGGIQAVDNLSFEVEAGQIMALIGPNGSGKSTTLNLITSVYPLSAGAIYFDSFFQPVLPAKRFSHIHILTDRVWVNL